MTTSTESRSTSREHPEWRRLADDVRQHAEHRARHRVRPPVELREPRTSPDFSCGASRSLSSAYRAHGTAWSGSGSIPTRSADLLVYVRCWLHPATSYALPLVPLLRCTVDVASVYYVQYLAPCLVNLLSILRLLSSVHDKWQLTLCCLMLWLMLIWYNMSTNIWQVVTRRPYLFKTFLTRPFLEALSGWRCPDLIRDFEIPRC